ncbi:hypothetical protein CK203_104953 [Vitis vinifera]|uniref:Uncharacterized protein n=1 Tax=Vitis vinifera TaxID=29760 RepID=A0A438BQ93_VITVI|nr:hypothetical protein CK203_104953 [Vitis vinifera]
MPFSDFHAELLNYDLMQQFHNHTIQPETGSYALYSHKNSSKPRPRSHNINRSRFSGTSKFPGSVPSSSPFRQPLPHLPSSSSPPVSHASREASSNRVAAMVVEANTTYLNQHQWYADSGANIHVTSDAANLAISQLMKALIPWRRNVIFDEIVFPARVQSPLMDSGSRVPSTGNSLPLLPSPPSHIFPSSSPSPSVSPPYTTP